MGVLPEIVNQNPTTIKPQLQCLEDSSRGEKRMKAG